MKYLIVLFFMIFSAEVSAQDTTEVKIYNSVLEVGEMLDFGKGSIKFKEVISDSRCPTGVTCIWPGEATILVELFQNGVFQKEKIITVGSGKTPLDLLAAGVSYNLNSLVLLPYPDVKTKEQQVSYSLHVRISEIADKL